MNGAAYSVLAVDDDVDTCQNLSDILTDLGYRVDFAHDGPTALELVRRNHYDVALLDLKMPGMDGVTLYREIKRIRAGTVAIIVSAYATSATADEAITAGAWQILSKPVDFPKLLSLVQEAVGRALASSGVGMDRIPRAEQVWSIRAESIVQVDHVPAQLITQALQALG